MPTDLYDIIRFFMLEGLTLDEAIGEYERVMRYKLPDNLRDLVRREYDLDKLMGRI